MKARETVEQNSQQKKNYQIVIFWVLLPGDAFHLLYSANLIQQFLRLGKCTWNRVG